MYYNPIEFPGLGIGPFDFNPTAFTLPLIGAIQWYGVIIAIGFTLALLYCSAAAPKFGLTEDQFSDSLFFAVPLAIIGARLYFVVFNFSIFKDNLISVFYIRNGGVAIYGAVIFSLITAFVYAKIRKISPLALLDVGCMGLLIGQAIGRWANFANREAFGGITDLPWRMEIYVHEYGKRAAVHPTFFYEFLWTSLGFVLLHFLSSRRKYNGQLLLTYIAWYGLGRGFIEGLRTDSLYFFNTGIRVSQLLAFLSFITAAGLLVFFRVRRKTTPENDT